MTLQKIAFIGIFVFAFSGCQDPFKKSFEGNSNTTTEAGGETAPLSTPVSSTISQITPADGATLVDRKTKITVTFSDVISPASMKASSNSICSGSFQLSSDGFDTCVAMSSDPVGSNKNKTYTMAPAAKLKENTSYKIRVTKDILNQSGGGLDALYTSAKGFKTGVSQGLTISAISGNTTEALGAATFTVHLDRKPDGDVTIGLSSSDETEGTVSPTSLVFTADNWAGLQVATVTGVDDNLQDGDVNYTVILGATASTDSEYNGLDPADITVINVDNDTAGFTVSTISGATSELGASATVSLKLNTKPTGDVVVAVSSDDTTEGTTGTSSLTFTDTNWSANQTITVTGVNDDSADGSVTYHLVLGAATSTDTDYSGLDPADVSVINTDNDTAGVTVSAISGDTSESTATATFTVKLNTQPSGDVTLPVSSSAPAEGAVSAATLTFTSVNWAADQTVTVTGVDDAVQDGNVGYQILLGTLTSTDTGYQGMNPADLSLTNIDNDSPGFTLGNISGKTTEGATTATFTLKLSSAPTADVVCPVVSADTTEGTVSPASVTFTTANWSANQTVTVTGVDDTVADGNISYFVQLNAVTSTDANYSGLNPADVVVTNLDNETAGFITTATSGATTEALGTATFTVKLTSQPTADVVIPVTSSDTTEGTVSPTSLTFTSVNWNSTQTVTFTGVDDLIADGSIGYRAELGAATSVDGQYSGLTPAAVSISNTDNDTAGFTIGAISGSTTEASAGTATFTVKLTSEPVADVVIALSSSDLTEGTISPASLTFTSVNWNGTQTVTVTGVDDSVADGNIVYNAVLAPATSTDRGYSGLDPADVAVSNTDNDSAGFTISTISTTTTELGAGQATFTIKLTSEPTADVLVGLTSSDLTEGTVSASSITFTSVNWNGVQTLTVTGVDDFVADGNIAYTAVLAAATSADGNYNGMDPADVAVTNNDDDSPGFTISAISGATTELGAGTATFTVTLASQPTADVTIPVVSADTTEGIVSPASLVFTSVNWNGTQSVTVTGVDDTVVDGNISYNIQLQAVTSGDTNYNTLDPSDVSVTNTDDDTPGFTVSAASGQTSEAGAQATFSVKLNSQPTADVVVALTSSDTTEGIISPSSLTFTSLNWNGSQTVQVFGVDDTVADGNVGYTITTGVAVSADGVYSGLNPSDVPVINVDNDSPGFTISTISGTTSEAGGSATFTVVLNSQPTADVAVGLTSSDTTEGTVSPASLSFTPGNWSGVHTVTVFGVDDFVVDGNIAYRVVTAAATSADPSYSAMAPADVAVTNVDND